MPTCINDSNKKYNGSEKTPLGVGYSASAEPLNKIMIGKDDNFYIVTQTNNNKRWKKIKDCENLLENLPNEMYIPYFKPNVKLIQNETGLEEKFGGNKPFFVKGEVWPSKDEYHMTFFCQLKDPRKKDNMLYRVFVMLDDDGIQEDFWINKIELTPENIKNQIIIEKPKYSEEIKNNKYFNEEVFDAYEIIGWNKGDELKSFETIRKYYGIPPYQYKNNNRIYNKLEEIYHELSLSASPGVKVGGTPLSTQDQEQVQDYDFLQLEYENYIPYMWGDCGIAHVSEDCQFTWDCC
jgi:uncharacterized protein YwqG